ncbi:MAG: erythrose-4-phosphate dehydrogenase [Cycloclasticus sp. symbiont of Poecilosclerida sp. M]|nr:MAG: erythrose-4-phosphate dehydrogenase [Cycloclasticus sp. symbiont of Poecilosclerida sp. M]
MGIRVAINGFGRIGRTVLRALYESSRNEDIQLVAINDLASIEESSERLKKDISLGRGNTAVEIKGDTLLVAGDVIQYTSQANPVKLLWKTHDIDVVLECTGQFTQAEPAHMHILAGAEKVLISALSDEKVDATIVYGVNESALKPEHKIVSNGSCTLNCLAHLVKALDKELGVQSGLSTSLHEYDSRQELAIDDGSMIPTQTLSPKSIGLVLPNLEGKIDGVSIRVPTFNVALLDLTFTSKERTTVEAVNAIMQKTAARLEGVVEYRDELLVSASLKQNAASCVFDATQTNVKQDHLVKVVAWFDNEWGFSNRLLDTAEAMMAC